MTESKNAGKLKSIIGFLTFDATDPKGLGGMDGFKNAELAVASFISEHFSQVVNRIDILDEADAQEMLEKGMKA